MLQNINQQQICKAQDLITPGCQLWFQNILIQNQNYFGYGSSSNIYFFSMANYNRCEKIISTNNKLIVNIQWNQNEINQIAVSTIEETLQIISFYQEIIKFEYNLKSVAIVFQWSLFEKNCLFLGCSDGTLKYIERFKEPQILLKAEGSQITSLDQNQLKSKYMVLGDNIGFVYIFDIENKQLIDKYQYRKEKILDVKFDLNHPSRYVVLYENGKMLTANIEKMKIEQIFNKSKQYPQTVKYIKQKQGMLITASIKDNFFNIWNVQDQNFVEQVKINETPIIDIIPLPYFRKSLCFLISHTDGQVSLFDSQIKETIFKIGNNHTEAIYDIQINPHDKNIIATSSFDGTIKIWDYREKKCLQTLFEENHTIQPLNYSDQHKVIFYFQISWSPVYKNILVSTNNLGELQIWNTTFGRLDFTRQLGLVRPIIKQDWNKINIDYIATSSQEKKLWVVKLHENHMIINNVYQFDMPSNVISVKWGVKQQNKNHIAVGLQNGILQVIDIKQKNKNLQIIYRFNLNSIEDSTLEPISKDILTIDWNPYFENLLAYAGEDSIIRIIDIQNQNFEKQLIGHNGKVKSIKWNYELPHILVSGGSDNTIKIWDIFQKLPINEQKQIKSEVHALQFNSQRPFMLLSVNKDLSIRFWDISDKVLKLRFDVLLNPQNFKNYIIQEQFSIQEFQDKFPHAEIIGLFGTESKRIWNIIDHIQNQVQVQQFLTEFFQYQQDENDFWHILDVVINDVEQNLKSKVIHINKIEEAFQQKSDEYKQQDQNNQNKDFYQNQNKVKEQVLQAAKIKLQLGNIQEYCDLLVTIGEWEKALAIAPAVSHSYWGSLARQYADYLQLKDPEEGCLYFIATKQLQKAINTYAKREKYTQAQILLKISNSEQFDDQQEIDFESSVNSEQMNNYKKNLPYESLQQSRVMNNNLKNNISKVQLFSNDSSNKQLKQIIIKSSKQALTHGQALLSASLHLSISDIEGCITKLILSNNYLTAYFIAKILHSFQLKLLKKIILKLAIKHHNKIIIKQFCKDENLQQVIMNHYYNKPNFLSIQELNIQKSASIQFSLINQQIIQNIISQNYVDTAVIFVQEGKRIIQSQEFVQFLNLNTSLRLLKYLRLGIQVEQKLRSQVQFLARYIGFKKAIFKGYFNILPSMYESLLQLMQSNHVKQFFFQYEEEIKGNLVFSQNYIDMEFYSNVIYLNPKKYAQKLNQNIKDFNPIWQEKVQQLIKKSQYLKNYQKQIHMEINKNKMYFEGKNIPIFIENGKDNMSYSHFTRSPISGEGHIQEDLKSVITKEEAYMWYICDPFSYTNNGQIIYPN